MTNSFFGPHGSTTPLPDGGRSRLLRTIACIQRPVALARVKIALVPIDGGPARLIEPKDVPRELILAWNSDGQSLVYIKNEGSVSNLWQLPLNGGEPKQITNFESSLIFNFAISQTDDWRSLVAPKKAMWC